VIVVSNTSPILNLAAIGQLELLNQLYERVLIPRAVNHEITAIGAGQPGAMGIQRIEWIEVRQVTDRTLVTALCTEIDEGEAEAIALAIEQKADLLLLDERRGRIVASRLGIPFIGLMGVLIDGKHKGYIPAIKPLLDGLIAEAGFWVSQQLYGRVLTVAGE
jgi:hypothetical protein